MNLRRNEFWKPRPSLEDFLKVEREAEKGYVSQHRALDKDFNLLKVSPRRWRVIKMLRADQTHNGEKDVLVFEFASQSLGWQAAFAELIARREGR